jgi:N-acetylglucosaminyldiphosphoundecaprenol N-acetyl-beta-D-mannosaminyltransferase
MAASRTTVSISPAVTKVQPPPHPAGQKARGADHDDFTRNVHCLLGLPIDAVDLRGASCVIREAAAQRLPFLVSTPNLNFLIGSLSDPEFTESLLISDLCTADGAPIVWIAKLLGIPVRERVAGSDLFEMLRSQPCGSEPLRVFLFGGAEGVAEAACAKLNSEEGGLHCVGTLSPGFVDVEDMSDEETIETINASEAQVLIAALGAKKAQAWFLRNHDTLKIPVRVHLGATLNFAAGTVSRAPKSFQDLGLEWLWRIKEEPYLWRRYAGDGLALSRLLLSRIAPLAAMNAWHRARRADQAPTVSEQQTPDATVIKVSGGAFGHDDAAVRTTFANAVTNQKSVVLDLENLHYADSGFLGLVLMLRKQLRAADTSLRLAGVTPRIARLLRLNGLGGLIGSEHSAGARARPQGEAERTPAAIDAGGVAVAKTGGPAGPDRAPVP